MFQMEKKSLLDITKKIEALKQQTAAGLRTRAIGNMFFTAV